MKHRLIMVAQATVMLYATSCAAAPQPVTQDPGGAPVVPATAPALDTARITQLIATTRPADPTRILFDWSLQMPDMKVQGKGIVRMQGPYHARLDLFVAGDVQVLRASLIDDKVDIVHSGPSVPLPPVEFLWSLLGVFRVPTGAATPSMTHDADGLTLSYVEGSSRWRFRADSASLRSAEWQGSDSGRRTVELSGPFQMARPAKAVYRDWREFRELVMTVTAIEKVEPFAPDTWNVSNR